LMSKFVRVLLVTSVTACSASVVGAAADVKGDPTDILLIEKGRGDGVPAIRYAQLVQEQHTTNATQIFYNIVTDGGAACNGDMVTATRSTTIAKGTRLLSVSADTFTSGDVGKAIAIPGAGNSGGK